jgi:hypothetical protein
MSFSRRKRDWDFNSPQVNMYVRVFEFGTSVGRSCRTLGRREPISGPTIIMTVLLVLVWIWIWILALPQSLVLCLFNSQTKAWVHLPGTADRDEFEAEVGSSLSDTGLCLGITGSLTRLSW